MVNIRKIKVYLVKKRQFTKKLVTALFVIGFYVNKILLRKHKKQKKTKILFFLAYYQTDKIFSSLETFYLLSIIS